MKKLFRLSLLIQGLIWITFGGINILGNRNPMFLIFGFLMIVNGIIFLLLFRAQNSTLLMKIFSLVFILTNLILTLTDQMGAFDYTVLVLNMIGIVGIFRKCSKHR